MSIHNSTQLIKDIRKNPENYYIIHYSCQSLNDDNEGLSPRITSIAISHFATEQTVSFSTHSIAEELHISREDVKERFDDVELMLLRGFYNFVRDRRDKHWIHWNMRNLTYGFEHLEHRYRVLGGIDATVIPVERRLNLNDLLCDRYGADYAPHPKLKGLMELNGGIHRHFLEGLEEVAAFQNNEFIRMHNSTLTKVGFMHQTIRKLISGKLRTSSKGYGVKLDRLFESRFTKSIALTGTVLGIVLAILQIVIWAF
ncbi:hypothetical protein L6172_04975 [Thalassospiraceae bacterium SW-3-3]|nr:hypothetical protein L6172_04975 [Thalassospiraceae bacterium SW-3-3]